LLRSFSNSFPLYTLFTLSFSNSLYISVRATLPFYFNTTTITLTQLPTDYPPAGLHRHRCHRCSPGDPVSLQQRVSTVAEAQDTVITSIIVIIVIIIIIIIETQEVGIEQQ
jgi:hypothetical protein